jgi:ABC-type multidrug transport system fused ATPase/permease subunit
MRIILRIVGFVVRRHKGRLALAYVSLIGAALSSLLVPSILGDTMTQVLAGEKRSALYLLALGLLGVGTARGLFAFGQNYLAESLSQKVAYDLRNSFFDSLQRLSFAFHDRQQTGDLMSRATADVEGVRMFLQMGMVRSLFMFIQVVAIAVIMFRMHAGLATLAMIFVPFVAFRSLTMHRLLRITWTLVQQLTGKMTTVLQENFSGIRVVKAFGAEAHETRKFNHSARQVADYNLQASRLQASNVSAMSFIFTLATGAVLFFGGHFVLNGREVLGTEIVDGRVVETLAWGLSPGDLTKFLLYMGMLNMPIRLMGNLVNAFSRAASSGERIFHILDAESPVKEKKGALVLRRVEGHVAFENASFSYDSYFPTLKEISFDAPPGSTVALLGKPGSGKSTLVHLISRFYDVSEGRIAIDGTDIRDATLASLRANIGTIQQDIFLYTASIRDNIAYGMPDAPFESIQEAAKIAQLHEFIIGLPNGYDSWIGERGITLSGGQRQRLSIARTLLLDPPILIMDDSLSSVDAQTESLIQRALIEVIRGRTAFIIAHRLSTLRNADFILVLKEGQIIERGTHQELLEAGGIYGQIYDMQLRPQEQAPSQTTQVDN